MKKYIILSAFFTLLTHVTLAQHKRWTVGIDYVRVSWHKEFRENADIMENVSDPAEYRKNAKWGRHSPTIWLAYNHPKHWNIMVKFNNYYTQGAFYRADPNFEPRYGIIQQRSAQYLDYMFGYNIVPHLFSNNAYMKNHVSIIPHIGIRHYHKLYASSISNVITYQNPLGYHQFEYTDGGWMATSFFTFRPATQLMVKYNPIPWVFIAGSAAWAYTAPKMNPVTLHLSIGANF